jgi:hypothetical protein
VCLGSQARSTTASCSPLPLCLGFSSRAPLCGLDLGTLPCRHCSLSFLAVGLTRWGQAAGFSCHGASSAGTRSPQEPGRSYAPQWLRWFRRPGCFLLGETVFCSPLILC